MYSQKSMLPKVEAAIKFVKGHNNRSAIIVTAGLQTEMKEPKKTPKAILFGLIIVTVIY